jgi:nucleotide-binding universal stress UspA family protein
MMQKILVGTDTTASADMAVSVAAELAGEREAELLVLYVQTDDRATEAADPRKPADPQRYLAGMTERFPEIRVRSWGEPGDPAERICEVAAEERVDTIVLGNNGVGGPRWRARESVPNLVLRHDPCSVFIVDTRTAR